MIDIVGLEDGSLGDLRIQDTQVMRASNLLSIQIGALEYAPAFGIDLKYFVDNTVKFQTESFKGYLVERLAAYGINVTEVRTAVETLAQRYTINVAPDDSSTGMVAR